MGDFLVDGMHVLAQKRFELGPAGVTVLGNEVAKPVAGGWDSAGGVWEFGVLAQDRRDKHECSSPPRLRVVIEQIKKALRRLSLLCWFDLSGFTSAETEGEG